jgi:hypothetical protein
MNRAGGFRHPKENDMAGKKHPGFKNVAASMARRQHVSVKTANRELAASSRGASPTAHKANPRLNRVRGK